MKSKNILIIDDDARNIFALSAVLRSRGYSCSSSQGAMQAMEALVNERPSVILLDMMMPQMDGYEAIPLLKRNPRSGDIPIVAVTAQAMVGDREKCLAAGADDYLSKPIDVDRLLEIIEHLSS